CPPVTFNYEATGQAGAGRDARCRTQGTTPGQVERAPDSTPFLTISVLFMLKQPCCPACSLFNVMLY
ncbi:MAG TPA: hypothetical protein VN328_13685, partial [Thermodesulfovibrionales bacterium]|nr:hypothetical protein [Thermodesulfovibrionales bacterium]